jgi:hypothetical protein
MYNTFENSDSFSETESDEKTEGNICYCEWCKPYCSFLLVNLVFASNVIGLIIGTKYYVSHCYIDKGIVSLSVWLLVYSSLSMLNCILSGIWLIVNKIYKFKERLSVVIYSVPFLLLVTLVWLCMGAIEAFRQCDTCFKDVPAVCETSVLSMVLGIITILLAVIYRNY